MRIFGLFFLRLPELGGVIHRFWNLAWKKSSAVIMWGDVDQRREERLVLQINSSAMESDKCKFVTLGRRALLIVKCALTHGQGLTASLGKKPILLVARILPCEGKRLLAALQTQHTFLAAAKPASPPFLSPSRTFCNKSSTINTQQAALLIFSPS